LSRGPRFLGVEGPLLLQFSIALFTGMVAATLVPPVRKSIPRPVEILAWTALLLACVIGIIGIASPNARELTMSAVWGIDQVISTLVGLLGAGLVGWLADNRFAVATVVMFVLGADILALALVRSFRKSRGWQPRVRLIEWMELPRLAPAPPQPVAVPYALDELNRKWGAAAAIAGAALLTWLLNFAIWSRDVLLPRQAERLARAAAAGRRACLVHGRRRTRCQRSHYESHHGGAQRQDCTGCRGARARAEPGRRHSRLAERAVNRLVRPGQAGTSGPRGGG